MFDVPYIISQDSITLVIDGDTFVVNKTHKSWDVVKTAIKNKDKEALLRVIDVKSYIELTGDLKLEGGFIFYKGEPIHNSLTDRILKMQEEGFDVSPMIAFLENLLQNPSSSAVNELYLFLESSNLPITNDGYFLAYKRVNDKYFDFYSNTFDNGVGKIVEMPRFQVDDRRDVTCSKGLHFCSLSYLSAFHSNEGKIVILKINPKDVVSIPADYNNSKGRCCKYEVIGEHKYDQRTHAFDRSVIDDVLMFDGNGESDNYDDYTYLDHDDL